MSRLVVSVNEASPCGPSRRRWSPYRDLSSSRAGQPLNLDTEALHYGSAIRVFPVGQGYDPINGVELSFYGDPSGVMPTLPVLTSEVSDLFAPVRPPSDDGFY